MIKQCPCCGEEGSPTSGQGFGLLFCESRDCRVHMYILGDEEQVPDGGQPTQEEMKQHTTLDELIQDE